jgi:hypothetical protein
LIWVYRHWFGFTCTLGWVLNHGQQIFLSMQQILEVRKGFGSLARLYPPCIGLGAAIQGYTTHSHTTSVTVTYMSWIQMTQNQAPTYSPPPPPPVNFTSQKRSNPEFNIFQKEGERGRDEYRISFTSLRFLPVFPNSSPSTPPSLSCLFYRYIFH